MKTIFVSLALRVRPKLEVISEQAFSEKACVSMTWAFHL
jgi:hypothetical protein